MLTKQGLSLSRFWRPVRRFAGFLRHGIPDNKILNGTRGDQGWVEAKAFVPKFHQGRSLTNRNMAVIQEVLVAAGGTGSSWAFSFKRLKSTRSTTNTTASESLWALVINAGSSSLKYALFAVPKSTRPVVRSSPHTPARPLLIFRRKLSSLLPSRQRLATYIHLFCIHRLSPCETVCPAKRH